VTPPQFGINLQKLHDFISNITLKFDKQRRGISQTDIDLPNTMYFSKDNRLQRAATLQQILHKKTSM
jgi:hypothetical protein